VEAVAEIVAGGPAVQTVGNVIAGERVDARDRRTLVVENPATGAALAEIPASAEGDMDAAVAAARRAADAGPWPGMPAAERAALLHRALDLLAGQADLLDLAVADTGCPRRLAGALQVGAAIGWAHALVDATARHQGGPRTLPPSGVPFGVSEVQYAPYGVVGVLLPYNFPLALAGWKVLPALAAGNTVVVKPSPLAPMLVDRLFTALLEAGLPEGVANLVHGDVAPAVRLAEHPGVDKLTFTGSTAVGRSLLALAAPRVVPCTLELGGKSPSIVLPDADIDLAARGSAFSVFIHSGQVCGATSRILVPADAFEDFVARMGSLGDALVLGDPQQMSTDTGPVISAQQVAAIEAKVDRATGEGATVVSGGRRPAGMNAGHYYEPTVLVGADNGSWIAREEVFGPVACVIPYDGVDAAVAMANDNPYGLCAAVWGSDLRAARGVASRLQAGTVWINDCNVLSPDAPFGGFKQSGLGRELGPEGLAELVQPRHVYTALDADVSARAYALVGSHW
jgi:acyl-CoA reductase-like NAD-dependent aldehyde dehydrogenase